MKIKKILVAVSALFTTFIYSCRKDENVSVHLFNGTSTTLGNGSAYSWIETDDARTVKTIGITFQKSAFNNLPADAEAEYILRLPLEKVITPFQTVVLDWNPHGHAPEHIYDKPHFDLHFYLMEESERLTIPEYATDSTKYLKFPGADYLPTNYVPIPGGEAEMGTHWVDLTSPELSATNPQVFGQTFVYGSYNGNVTFYEPMATLAYLTTVTAFSRDIPQPLKYGKTGYYPTKMSFADKGNTMEVTLHDFIYHTKS